MDERDSGIVDCVIASPSRFIGSSEEHKRPSSEQSATYTGIVIADTGINRHAINQVAIRLVVGEEPIIVLVAGITADAEKSTRPINIVAGR